MLSLNIKFISTPYTETFTMSETIVAYQSFVGVDLHKCTVTLVAVGADGEIRKMTISTKCTGKIDAWLLALSAPVWMAVETVGFVEWFIDRFRGCVDRIDIADATELANLRGKPAGKTTPTTRRRTSPCGWPTADVRWGSSPTTN